MANREIPRHVLAKRFKRKEAQEGSNLVTDAFGALVRRPAPAPAGATTAPGKVQNASKGHYTLAEVWPDKAK